MAHDSVERAMERTVERRRGAAWVWVWVWKGNASACSDR